MNPLSNLPSASSTQASDDADERARRDERKAAENNPAKFRTALNQAGAPAAAATTARAAANLAAAKQPAPAKGKDGKPVAGGATAGGALSPALLKMQSAAGTDAAAAAKAAPGNDALEGAAAGHAGPALPDQPASPNPAATGKAARYDGGALHPAMLSVIAQQAGSADAAPFTESARQDARAAAQSAAGSSSSSIEKASSGKSESASDVDPADAAAAGLTPQAGAAAARQATPTPQAGGPASTIPVELIQQVVEYATVSRNTDGFMEFRMGLSRDALGGVRVRVTAYGNRRVGLKIQNGEGEDAVGEGEVQGLIAALKARNVEVVDVTVD